MTTLPRTRHLLAESKRLTFQSAKSMFRGLEFEYTRLVANIEKLSLSYVGNHDGEVHDIVEILASGEVISGKDDGKVSNLGSKSEFGGLLYTEGASVMVLGVILGFLVGLFSRKKKESEVGFSRRPRRHD